MNLVARLRRSTGLTQSALAALAGTSQPTIAAYETGTKRPSLRTLQRLASAAGLGVHVAFVPHLTREDRRSLALHERIADRLRVAPAETLARAPSGGFMANSSASGRASKQASRISSAASGWTAATGAAGSISRRMYTRQCSPTTCCGWFAYCQPDTRHRARLLHLSVSRAPWTARYVLLGRQSGLLCPFDCQNCKTESREHR